MPHIVCILNLEKSQNRNGQSKEMRLFKQAIALYQGDPIYGFYTIESFPYARIRSIFSKRLSVTDKEIMKLSVIVAEDYCGKYAKTEK